MKSVRANLLLLLSSLPFIGGKAAAVAVDSNASPVVPERDSPVSLRPLNYPADNLFAGHRSHSSHASHRSSSGGGYSTPQPRPQPQEERSAPAPRGAPPSPGSVPGDARGLVGPGTAQPTDPGRAAPVSPRPASPAQPTLTRSEKLTLQVMRVQIGLTSLGLFTGPVNGVLDDGTKEAIKRFQIIKGLESNGLMTTETLNALGVPAVQ